MRLGIASWTVPWSIGVPGYPPPPDPLTPLGLLELAASLGVKVLQIADNMPLDRLSPRELAELGQAAKLRGIALQTGTRGLEPEQLLLYLEISQQVGARLLRTVSRSVGGKPSKAEIRAALSKVLPEFEAAGVVLALENNEAHRVEEFAGLVRDLGSPSLGICLDTANSLGALEITERVVQTLAPYAVELHAKDFVIQRIDTRMGFSVAGCPAGQGRVDFDWVLAQLGLHGRDPDVILEHWPPFLRTIEETIAMEREWLDMSMRFLRPRVR